VTTASLAVALRDNVRRYAHGPVSLMRYSRDQVPFSLRLAASQLVERAATLVALTDVKIDVSFTSLQYELWLMS
jgi:hypothetical protein